jgi:hypothetical protein
MRGKKKSGWHTPAGGNGTNQSNAEASSLTGYLIVVSRPSSQPVHQRAHRARESCGLADSERDRIQTRLHPVVSIRSTRKRLSVADHPCGRRTHGCRSPPETNPADPSLSSSRGGWHNRNCRSCTIHDLQFARIYHSVLRGDKTGDSLHGVEQRQPGSLTNNSEWGRAEWSLVDLSHMTM